jgi:fumarate reductase flavoprotein subunit
MIKLEGDGIALAREAGAVLCDSACMVRESAQTFTRARYHMPIMVSIHQPYVLVVNKNGDRILDEAFGSNNPSIFSNIIIQQPDQMVFALFDQRGINEYVARSAQIKVGNEAPPVIISDMDGLFKQLSDEGAGVKVSGSLEEMAAWIGAPADRLKESISRYNRFCTSGYDEDFLKDRQHLMPLMQPPYYAVKFTTLMIDTIGPVRVNQKMEVIGDAVKPIPGLYAAGVVAGGWTSHDYSQDLMFGGCIGWSVNSGRIAAENALKYLNK